MTLVTIVCTSYNKGRFIEAAVNSVKAQTYRHWELIVVDDCSTDDSMSILTVCASGDERVHLIRNEFNRGANFCRNVALHRATGNFVIFLDADDILSPRCIETRLAEYNRHPSAAFGVFSMSIFNKQPGDMRYTWKPRSRTPLDDFLQHSLPWTIIQPLWKKDFLISLKGFDESFDRLQDVELHTRALLEAPGYFMSPGAPDCYVRVSEERKSLDDYQLMTRWVNASLRFVEKFKRLLDSRKRRFLAGTIFMPYIELLLRRKKGTLSEVSFLELERLLLDHEIIANSRFVSFVFHFAKEYNLRVKRIPGVNRFLKLILTIKTYG